MNNLIDRYAHQVGSYLPQRDRADVEAELRSMIQDKLDDRYEQAPTQEQVVAVLKELGSPQKMAASYGRDQYLIGPQFYPFMMMVLRRGWVLIPTIVVIVQLVGVFIDGEQTTVISLIAESVFTVAQALFIFSAVVILIFAILERSGEELKLKEEAFNPLELPDVNEASHVDRIEAAFGSAIGTLFGVIMLYFISVGGLTLRLNVTNPSEVIPVSVEWMALFAVTSFAMAMIGLVVLLRNRWNLGWWSLQTVLEFIGAICLYFVLFKPIVERLLETAPNLREIGIIASLPELILISVLVVQVASNGTKWLSLWGSRRQSSLYLA